MIPHTARKVQKLCELVALQHPFIRKIPLLFPLVTDQSQGLATERPERGEPVYS
jgi:hypothetical protein